MTLMDTNITEDEIFDIFHEEAIQIKVKHFQSTVLPHLNDFFIMRSDL